METLNIRKISSADSAKLLRLKLKLDQEAEFMLYEPDERKATEKEVERQLKGYDDGHYEDEFYMGKLI